MSRIRLYHYQLPFTTPVNFNGQQLTMREGLILQHQDHHGRTSYGEIAPLPGFSKETLPQARSQIISLLNNGLHDQPPQEQLYPSVSFALDALRNNILLSETTDKLDSVPLLQGENDQVLKQYNLLKNPQLIKLKVARQKLELDIQLFQQLQSLNPHIKIRCDANQGWSKQQADCFFAHINNQVLDYIEEPTTSHQLNIELAKQFQIALAVDETIQNKNFHYQHNSGIKALVLKPTLIGSLARVEYFVAIANQYKLQVHISSSFESIIGLQQLTSLANHYQQKCAISLGIDTLKYLQPGLLTNGKQIDKDLQQLECLWSNN